MHTEEIFWGGGGKDLIFQLTIEKRQTRKVFSAHYLRHGFLSLFAFDNVKSGGGAAILRPGGNKHKPKKQAQG